MYASVTEKLRDFVAHFVCEWESTWVDPDDSSHEGAEEYVIAKLLIRERDDPSKLLSFAKRFALEWESLWFDPEEIDPDWAKLYAEAKDLIRQASGEHQTTRA